MKISQKIPLLNCHSIFKDVIIMKHHMLFLNHQNNTIFVYDLFGKYMYSFETCALYSCITKASCESLFLTRKQDNKNIYITDSDFHGLDTIPIRSLCLHQQEIISITSNPCAHQIFLATSQYVAIMTTTGEYIKSGLSKQTMKQLGLDTRYSYQRQHTLLLQNKRCLRTKITAISYLDNQLYMAYSKDHIAYVSILSNHGDMVETFYIGRDLTIETIFYYKNHVAFLITKKEEYNYIYVTNYRKKTISPPTSECNIEDICPFSDTSSMYDACCDILNSCCNITDSCCNIKEPCYEPCSAEQAKSNVIQSIALMEASLSHILNAEGEKIQKTVACSNTVGEMLETNDSVSNTISRITLLEQILSDKLKTVMHEKKAY